ncbi:MAG: histidine kinase [Bacteroidota bacterium]
MEAILKNRILQHIAFWCFYVCIYAFNYHKNNAISTDFFIAVFTLPSHFFFTYTQLYFLIPRFLLKRKVVYYLLSSIVLLKAATMLNWFSYSVFSGPLELTYMRHFSILDSLVNFDIRTARTTFAFLMICGIAVSIKLLKEWYKENDQRKKIENEKISMELEMLKAQLHPHFLFNTLNNLYSLTLLRSDKAPEVVTHLSDLLRYILYECNEKEVPLEKEIAVVKQYVELEKLRYGNRVDVGFSCEGNIEELSIAPLLLLPFAENCFKHGISEELDQCWINIYLQSEGNELNFIMSNSFSSSRQKTIAGGLGLQNISRRLELLYPGKYQLTNTITNETYTTKLNIKLTAIEALRSMGNKETHQGHQSLKTAMQL